MFHRFNFALRPQKQGSLRDSSNAIRILDQRELRQLNSKQCTYRLNIQYFSRNGKPKAAEPSIPATPTESATMNKTKTTSTMPIHITPHHLTLTAPLETLVRERFVALSRINRDILGAKVVLRRHHGTDGGPSFSASARLALPGQDIHAHSVDGDLYAAIRVLANLLSRRLRKRKTVLLNRKKRAFARRPDKGYTSAARLEALLVRRSGELESVSR